MSTRSYFFTEDFINQLSYRNMKEYDLSRRRRSCDPGHLPHPPRPNRRHKHSLQPTYSYTTSKQLDSYRKLYFDSIGERHPDDNKEKLAHQPAPVSKVSVVRSKSLTCRSSPHDKLIESRKTRSLDSPGTTLNLHKPCRNLTKVEFEYSGASGKGTIANGLEFPKDAFKSHEIESYLQQRNIRRSGISYENPKEIKDMLKGSRNSSGFFK